MNVAEAYTTNPWDLHMSMTQNGNATHGGTLTMKKATHYGASIGTMQGLVLPCRMMLSSTVPNPAWSGTRKIV